jgi:hypothetical protein
MTQLSFESRTFEEKINVLALKIFMRKTFADDCSVSVDQLLEQRTDFNCNVNCYGLLHIRRNFHHSVQRGQQD